MYGSYWNFGLPISRTDLLNWNSSHILEWKKKKKDNKKQNFEIETHQNKDHKRSLGK